MARPLRIEYPGAFYHLMNRGLERREIFRTEEDHGAFLDLCLELHRRFKVILHAYCLMPNHYHLMVETPEANLGRAMRHLDGVYTQAFNRRHRRVGPLFQGRYKAILMEKEAYALELSRYIHLNPVKAGLVSKPEAYPHSSFRDFLGLHRKPVFLHTDWLLSQVSSKRSEARRAFQEFTREGMKSSWAPQGEARGGVVLGTESFFEKIREKYLNEKQDREIPGLRKFAKGPDLAEVERCVEEICSDYRLRDKLKVWVLRRYTSLKLKDIADRLEGGLTYSAVSQICRRLERAGSNDRGVQKMMQALETKMSNVKT